MPDNLADHGPAPSLEAVQRPLVVAIARSWVGTPFHHMARLKGVGVDCAQLLAAVYEEAGIVPKIDLGFYRQDEYIHLGRERYKSFIELYGVPVETPKPGDVALYRFGSAVGHGAIVVEWPQIIHAYVSKGCVYDEGDSPMLLTDTLGRPRLRGFWTLWHG